MDALLASISGTCPMAFQGVTGQMFANAVAAVVAAHCTIFDDYQWPRDNTEEIFERGQQDFDFIVVGAGTAGSAIAGLLAEHNPSWTVLLVEAGDNPTLSSEVPAFLMNNQEMDWKYQTKQDNKSCLAFNNERCTWNKGRAMGGSSAINAMLYVRGHPEDFEAWRDSGNPGWGYKELSPYFEEVETKFKYRSYKYQDNPWYTILETAYKESGLTKKDNDKNEGLIGTKVLKLATRDGKRLNSAKLYLKEHANFFVMKNSFVRRVIVDQDTMTAKGIELKSNEGIVIQMSARREIILSAGSVSTPQILMLSGIGPRRHLNEKGIECIIDLPVGQNLQDHIILPLLFKTNMQIELTPEQMISSLLQYMLQKAGPLSYIGLTDYMGFLNTENDKNYPNIQLIHSYFTTNDKFILRPYFEAFGYNSNIVDTIAGFNKNSNILGIYPTLLHPRSRGEIKLSDSDPESAPEIVTNYFQDAQDIKTFIQAIRFIRKLTETETFKSFNADFLQFDLPTCKKFVFDSDEYWECYVRNLGATLYHPVGTAKMGPKNDPTAVVDHNLKVHGVHNLRVVDASIMPTITSGNTMAPTLLIAEKAYDIIKRYYDVKDEL